MAEADRLEREAERAAHAGQGSEKEFGYASNVQDELRRAREDTWPESVADSRSDSDLGGGGGSIVLASSTIPMEDFQAELMGMPREAAVVLIGAVVIPLLDSAPSSVCSTPRSLTQRDVEDCRRSVSPPPMDVGSPVRRIAGLRNPTARRALLVSDSDTFPGEVVPAGLARSVDRLRIP